jgi:hypothetical protein
VKWIAVVMATAITMPFRGSNKTDTQSLAFLTRRGAGVGLAQAESLKASTVERECHGADNKCAGTLRHAALIKLDLACAADPL